MLGREHHLGLEAGRQLEGENGVRIVAERDVVPVLETMKEIQALGDVIADDRVVLEHERRGFGLNRLLPDPQVRGRATDRAGRELRSGHDKVHSERVLR